MIEKRDMLWMKLRRVIRTGFFNFWRNGTVSLASVLVMIVTLLLIGFTTFSGAILDNTLQELSNKVDISITFSPTAPEEKVLEIKDSLESLPEVLLVSYLTREEVLEQFKERHADDQIILAALDELGENPFGATLNVKARHPSQYGAISDFLKNDSSISEEGLTEINANNYFENKFAIDRLTNIIDSSDRLGLILTVVMAVISILIAFNTIRLTIYIARDEISVMRLVGASTSYIQGPFVVVGIIYGLVAGIITLLLFLPLTHFLGASTESFFDVTRDTPGFNVFSYYLRNFLEIAFIILASGVTIGALSSILAIRRYLRI